MKVLKFLAIPVLLLALFLLFVLPALAAAPLINPADIEDAGQYHVVQVLGAKAAELMKKFGGNSVVVFLEDHVIVVCTPGVDPKGGPDVLDLGMFSLKRVHGESRDAIIAKYGKHPMLIDYRAKIVYMLAPGEVTT